MYYVIEFQTGANGAATPFFFRNREDAEAKYHTLLAVAAKSAVPKHGVMMVQDDLMVCKTEFYEHPAVASE